jgi:hypothetical protein
MKVRGERECKECGRRWSYYETGSVACPDCESLHSVGVGERKRHTASPVELDLSPAREQVETAPLEEVADAAAERCREYCRRQGFIDGGELRTLSWTYVAAAELAAAGSLVGRSLRVGDAEELYLLSLLRGADRGERPDAGDVPPSMRSARGLAAADAVEDYARDLRTYLDDHEDARARRVLGSIADHRRRVHALDGDVPPTTADGLVHAARALGRYLTDGEEGALAEARDHVDRLTDLD